MTFKYFKGLGAFTQMQATFQNAAIALQSVPISVKEFTFSEERDSEDLLGYAAGEHQAKVTLPGTPTYSLTLVSDIQTQQLLAFSRQEAWRDIPASTDVLRSYAAEVPADGIVTVPGLLSANIGTTSATIEDDNGVPLAMIDSGAPTAAQALLDTDGQITLDSSREGETVFVGYLAQPTSGKMAGGPVAGNPRHTLSEFSFVGDLYDTEAGDGSIWIPRCQVTSPPSITLNGGAAIFTQEATVLSQTGWDVPYALFKDVVWPS
ncbi:hypothetical protein D0962_17800 [Leptolyngbyaceae cyanobacterium CCMR0082]|uniref:Uncharacterized protein n=1 Tax=Adonisia turfae CCMR0082 TaxID=2304604 RepID=A0A6M0S861_9CYAN|nr:hypothetical protein [Adonisia turfae]NEZ64619.1 hypothetical protein [Adonisia turfae CCMR0082]